MPTPDHDPVQPEPTPLETTVDAPVEAPVEPVEAPVDTALEAVLATLQRYPDEEDEALVAVDATDRLILDEASGALASSGPGDVVVIDDRFGALTLGAATAHGLTGIRVHQDLLTGELALARNAPASGLDGAYTQLPLGPELLSGARVVLLQLPRSLAALRDVAEQVARHADPAVTVYAGGRLKHMTTAMNGVLAESFGEVRASLARQKSRVLVASAPLPRTGELTYPVSEQIPELGLKVAAYGAAFAGATLDIGTRYLLSFLDKMSPEARDAVDLGCGTGILAAELARARPGLQVVATDQSDAAVRSAAETARANGLEAQVHTLRDDIMSSLPDASVDLVLCNPPFHVGSSVYTGAAHRMFAAAARVLRPGGELWTVYNSHLRYRPALARMVGPTEGMGQNPKFTVTRSIKRDQPEGAGTATDPEARRRRPSPQDRAGRQDRSARQDRVTRRR